MRLNMATYTAPARTSKRIISQRGTTGKPWRGRYGQNIARMVPPGRAFRQPSSEPLVSVWGQERGVALVFGEIEPCATPCHRDEPWKTRLELMLPLLLEPEPLIPGDGPTRVFDIQNRNDLFVHAARFQAGIRRSLRHGPRSGAPEPRPARPRLGRARGT